MALGPACGVTQLAHEPSHALGDDDDEDDEEEDDDGGEGDEEGEAF
jgi:hypothetical protein